MADIDVEITIGGKLTALREKLFRSTTLMQAVMQEWVEMYGTYIKNRFNAMSRGAAGPFPQDGIEYGPWAKLSKATLGGRSRRNLLILVRTGLLRENVQEDHVQSVSMSGGRFTMMVKFISDAHYPETGVSVEDVFSGHQRGDGFAPQRKILVNATSELKRKMAERGANMIIEAVS